MRRAYHHADPLVAQAELEALAPELWRIDIELVRWP
jgi:hypothetical protein